MPRRSILLFAAACILIAASLAIVTVVVVTSRERATAEAEGLSTGAIPIGGPFQLVDQNGKATDQTVLNGKWSLVFFGYTYCPDFCPTTLNSLAATKARMGEAGKALQVVFISVDPARDTPQQLKDYLASDGFPDGVVGLTGTEQQIADVAKAYRTTYEKVGTGESYTMNHGLTVYLMGPDGKLRSIFAYDLGPEKTATLIQRVMKRG